MPPRRQMQRQARSSGSDRTVSISAAAAAKTALYTENAEDESHAQEEVS